MSEDDEDRASPARPGKTRAPYAVHPKERMPYSAPTILPPVDDFDPSGYSLRPRRRVLGWAFAGGALLLWWIMYLFVLDRPAPKTLSSPGFIATPHRRPPQADQPPKHRRPLPAATDVKSIDRVSKTWKPAK